MENNMLYLVQIMRLLKMQKMTNEFIIFKTAIPPELTVLYEGIQFYPIGYEMTFKQGISQHTAILHDMKSNNIVKVKLERVERYVNTD